MSRIANFKTLAERKQARREYSKKYKHLKGGKSSKIEMLNEFPAFKGGDFNGGLNPTCSHFGCTKQLSLTEALCGTVCTKHMGVGKIDATKWLSY